MSNKSPVRKASCHYARAIGDLNIEGIKQANLSSKARTSNLPGQHGAGKKKGSDYSLMLKEKQKLRVIHGCIKETQFRKFYAIAANKKGQTALNLLQHLEVRLVNIVFKAGFAATLAEARQLVSHKAITVTKPGKPTFITTSGSALIMPGMTVSVVEKARNQVRIQSAMAAYKDNAVEREWLSVDQDKFTAQVTHLPDRDQLPQNINENLIIELYSK